MQRKEMDRRRKSGVGFLVEAINELGPIADETRHSIREPILDLVEQIHVVGEELNKIRFDVYDRKGKLRLK